MSDHPAKCHFLDLPSEIRSTIYDLTFTPATDQPVELLTTEPPSKAFALTCRHIYKEARLVYRAAYRKFWRESNFVLSLTLPANTSALDGNAFYDSVYLAIHGLKREDVANVASLAVNNIYTKWTLEENVWVCYLADGTMDGKVFAANACEKSMRAEGFDDVMRDTWFGFPVALVYVDSERDIESVKKRLKGHKTTVQEVMGVVEDLEEVDRPLWYYSDWEPRSLSEEDEDGFSRYYRETPDQHWDSCWDCKM